MVVDKHTIRKTNQSMILENIICNQPISRATLSKETNLNKSTVSQITKELLEADLILEIGEGNSTSVGGRKPTMLKLNGEAGVSISIDLGANYIAVALFYINGKMIYEHITRDIEINKDNVISYILKAVKRVEKIKVNTVYGITGIGIAIHGITYKDKIIFTSYYDLDKMDLIMQLKDYFKYPIYIENEANLSALAESTFTSQHKNLVCLSVHSGIGVGIINNGELYSGQNGMAGEIGHTILIPDGDLCRCGNHGCLELYCSEVSILNQYQKQAKKKEMITSDSFCAAYHENDQIAVQLVEKMSKFLAIALNNIVVSYSPEIIYMNSPIIRRIPQMIEMITNRLESSFSEDVVVVNSNLGAKAILHGACALCTRHFLNVKHIKLTSVFTNETSKN